MVSWRAGLSLLCSSLYLARCIRNYGCVTSLVVTWHYACSETCAKLLDCQCSAASRGRRFDQRATLQPGPLLEASVEPKSCCREKYVETQLAKRLGRTDAAADAAPLDAQQRAEQELYGVPDNLKARRPACSPLKAGGKCNDACQSALEDVQQGFAFLVVVNKI